MRRLQRRAGVARDAREQVSDEEPRFLIYLPVGSAGRAAGVSVLLARSAGEDPHRLVAAIRTAMQGSAPNLPYADVRPFAALLAPQIRPWKMGATLFTMFGVLALVIAAVGLYSAIAYGVAQRAHEFGVRMALGAQFRDVVGLVMRQGVRATLAGVVLGSLAALGADRFIAGLLFERSPRDPVVFAGVAALVCLVAVAASWAPARRAARVDPARALRRE